MLQHSRISLINLGKNQQLLLQTVYFLLQGDFPGVVENRGKEQISDKERRLAKEGRNYGDSLGPAP